MDVSKVSKALAAALVTMLVAYLTKHGVSLNPVVTDAVGTVVDALVSAAAGFVVVWLAPKNK